MNIWHFLWTEATIEAQKPGCQKPQSNVVRHSKSSTFFQSSLPTARPPPTTVTTTVTGHPCLGGGSLGQPGDSLQRGLPSCCSSRRYFHHKKRWLPPDWYSSLNLTSKRTGLFGYFILTDTLLRGTRRPPGVASAPKGALRRSFPASLFFSSFHPFLFTASSGGSIAGCAWWVPRRGTHREKHRRRSTVPFKTTPPRL